MSSYTPRIHRAVVTRITQLTPEMVRITLGGPDMHDYPTTGVGDEYVRMFFPDHPGEQVRIPYQTDDGWWDYAEGVEPAVMRTYTIRNHRPGEIDVDFVVHDGGVAANWAGHAHVGDELGLNAPKELYNLPANATHQVLIADEPALPAALRIAELSAGQVTTHIVCEVRNAQNKIEPSMPGTRYTWLQGSGNGARPSQLAHIVRTLDLDSSGTTYVWVAGETRMTREIRTYLRKTLGLPNPAYKVVGYWTDKSEQWMQRYEALDQSVKDQIDELIANAEDLEVALDQVNEIYTRVGL